MTSPLSYLGTPDASTTVKGKVELATTAECVAGTDTTKACTPAGVAAVAIAGAPAASTTQAGIIQIATNGEAAAQAISNAALVPSNLPSIMASPGAIGGGTPAAGTFTTLTATTLVFTNPIDVAEGGTGLATITDHGIMVGSGTGAVTPLAVGTNNQLLIGQTGADPTWSNNIDVPGTLDVTGATTLDDTLDVAGTTTITAALTVDSLVVDDTTIDSNAIASTSTLDIDSAGALAVNSSAGAISIGNDAVAQAINVGTGAAARTITVGNSTGATSVVLNCGTGALNIGTNAVAHTITLGNSTGATSLVLDCGTGALNVGTNAVAHTVTIGNTTGATAVNVNSGTGACAWTTTNGAFSLVTGTGAINVGADAAAKTISIGNTTGATAVNLTAGSGSVNCATDFNLTSVATNITMNCGAATDFIGTATLVGGTVTVNNTNIAAGDRIMITRSALNASPALGFLIYTINPGVSFTVSSFSAAGAAVATDVSSFTYVIVRQT
jgi:hypothetical protein